METVHKSYGRLAKDLMFRELKKLFDQSEDFFVIQEEKLSVADSEPLRISLRQASARYCILKNSIFQKILQEKSQNGVFDLPQGHTGIVFCPTDPITTAKILVQFAKGRDFFKIRGGLLRGEKLSFESVETLAKLPSRKILIGMTLAGLKAPMTGIVLTLSGLLRQVVTVLDKIRQGKEK